MPPLTPCLAMSTSTRGVLMGKHRMDPEMSGDLNDLPDLEEAPRTMEHDSGGVQGIEYFGVDTRDQEENK
jgi:hypothetical protein